jgi:hypothetical protein
MTRQAATDPVAFGATSETSGGRSGGDKVETSSAPDRYPHVRVVIVSCCRHREERR